MAPAKQRAALVTENGVAFGIADVPKPGSGQILIKVTAAAQNPTDCQLSRPLFRYTEGSLYPHHDSIHSIGKSLKRALDSATYGGIVGHDFSGTVEALGLDVPEGVRTVGERVAGVIMGSQFLVLFVRIIGRLG